MNAVGIDVSKGKSMIAILRPLDEIVSSPFEVLHTSNGINKLIYDLCNFNPYYTVIIF